MKSNIIHTGTYKVGFGKTGYSMLKDLLRKKKYSSIFILVDENSHDNCLPRFIAHLPQLTGCEFLEIESGEQNKNIEICKNLWDALSDIGADRKSLLINLGGGVIGDMGGFVASTYMRGIDFVQVPTTLLSQVDASVGGKLGIDLGSLKNLVGTFADPQLVLADTSFLASLDDRQIFSGYAEILKHGLIANAKYWEEVSLGDPMNADNYHDLVMRSVMIKSAIVKKDPKEAGLRKILNFGHTIGHAMESYSMEGQGTQLLHGEAVIAGMICETYLSWKKAGLKKPKMELIVSRLGSMYKSRNFNKFDEHRLLELMKHDKKNVDGQYRFALLKDIGKAVFDVKCNAELIKDSLRFYRDLSIS